MIGKKVFTKEGWNFKELSEEEKENLMKKLLEENIKELKRIIERVNRENFGIDKEKVIQMLFDKQATQSFSLINSEIEKKSIWK